MSHNWNKLIDQPAGRIGLFLLTLLLHLCLQWLGNRFYFEPENVATLWPASGLLVALFTLTPYRSWWLVVSATLLSGVISDLLVFNRALIVFGFFASAELVEA